MEFTYAVWIGLCVLGILAGIYIMIKDKRAGTATKAKRELQATAFFVIVMFCTLVVALLETGFSVITFISLLFFIIGLFMIIPKLKEKN